MLCLLIASCPRSQGTTGFRYPPTWPIKALTVPPGVKQLQLPDPYLNTGEQGEWFTDGQVQAAGEPQERKQWSVAFEFNGDPAQLQQHLDECLKPLGFDLWGGGNLPDQERKYISLDRRQQVQIRFMDLKPMLTANFPGWSGYKLSIAFWTNPRPDIALTRPIP